MKVFQVSFLLILAVAICFATDSTEESSASVQDDVAAQLDQELENLDEQIDDPQADEEISEDAENAVSEDTSADNAEKRGWRQPYYRPVCYRKRICKTRVGRKRVSCDSGPANFNGKKECFYVPGGKITNVASVGVRGKCCWWYTNKSNNALYVRRCWTTFVVTFRVRRCTFRKVCRRH